MKRYFPHLKRYAWVLFACTVLATGIGLVMGKFQKPIYQATALVQVNTGPGDGFLPVVTPKDALGLASGYASTIMTRSVMDYVYQTNPGIRAAGYGPDDLLVDISTSASLTAPIISITATTRHPADTALLADAVATGFNRWQQAQNQAQLTARRTALQNQLSAYTQIRDHYAQLLAALPDTTDPRYAVYLSEMNDAISTMHSAESQLVALPVTTTSGMTILHLVTPADAVPPTSATIILVMTALIGLLVGGEVMLLLIYLDTRLFAPEQVRDKIGLAYLGSLTRDHELQVSPAQVYGPVIHELTDIGASLRLTGVLPGQWHAPQGVVLLVTSVQSTEGKTTLAAALAAAMARNGYRTVLIDGNLQHPATHFSIGMNPSGIGVSGLLTSGGSIDDAVKASPIPGVWLLPAGASLEEPTPLFTQRFPALLAQLRKKHDLLIIDGPALLTGAAAEVLASMVDGALIVVDFRHGRIPLLLRAKEIITRLSRVPAGVVLNNYPRIGRHPYIASAFPLITSDEALRGHGHSYVVGIEHNGGEAPVLPPASDPHSPRRLPA